MKYLWPVLFLLALGACGPDTCQKKKNQFDRLLRDAARYEADTNDINTALWAYEEAKNCFGPGEHTSDKDFLLRKKKEIIYALPRTYTLEDIQPYAREFDIKLSAIGDTVFHLRTLTGASHNHSADMGLVLIYHYGVSPSLDYELFIPRTVKQGSGKPLCALILGPRTEAGKPRFHSCRRVGYRAERQNISSGRFGETVRKAHRKR